jgi:hypothetical protein
MIVVTVNYRLSIFGFGDGTERNLALKDQRLAIEWVVKHISGFGGDKVAFSPIWWILSAHSFSAHRITLRWPGRVQEQFIRMLI